MRAIRPMEIGLVFWADRASEEILQQLRRFGLSAGQLGVPPEMVCDAVVAEWAAALDTGEVSLTSAVCSYRGEDYSDLGAVHRTVGFTPVGVRADRTARTMEVSDFAAKLGIPAVSCHIGFIPADRNEALFAELRDLTMVICDHCARHGQSFVLETGQESAEALLGFIEAVGRPNLKVNFDPANMVMYGAGDPIAALDTLEAHVLSVHCKDANPPVAGSGQLGKECVLGAGRVDFPAFLQALQRMDYRGLLSIEREERDAEQRTADIHTAVLRLMEWKAGLGL